MILGTALPNARENDMYKAKIVVDWHCTIFGFIIIRCVVIMEAVYPHI